jgi:hypothetical protein
MDERDLNRGSTQQLRSERADKLAALRSWWFVVPVIVALGLICASRILRSLDAERHINGVAQLVVAKAELNHLAQCGVALDDVGPIVNDVVRSQYGVHGEKLESPEAEARARVLVRTVASDLSRLTAAQPERCGKQLLEGFEREVRIDLWWGVGATTGFVGLVLAALASLFIADIYSARRAVQASGHLPGQSYDSLEHEIACERAWRTLERPDRFFTRRFGFALLIAAGASYLLAPIGLQASIIGDYATLHPIIGADSIPHFVEQARNASPVSIGFFGFMIYSLLTIADRALHRDLDDRLFVALVNRGLVVFILSLVLAAVTDGGPISRSLIFLAGVFPKTGIDALAKLGQLKVEQITSDETAGFELLRDINFPKGVTLRQLGILDAVDLARADVHDLVLQVGIEPQTLFDAVDQAILIHTFGAATAKKLESVPLYSATQLLDYVGLGGSRDEARLALVVAALEVKDISVQLDDLAANPNVIYLRRKKEEYSPPRAALSASPASPAHTA